MSAVGSVIIEILGDDKALKKTINQLDKTTGAAIDKNLKSIGMISAAVAGVGALALKSATDYDQAVNQLAASTGLGTDAMAECEAVLQSIYANNYGESFEDIASAMATVRQQMGELSADALQGITESAFALRDTFGYEVTESVRAANALVKQFGISGDEAMNLIANGAQNGLDFSGELMDTISEYSVQFAKLGLSADEMFHVLQAGADSGAWNLDKIGDAIKENAIRVIDMSDSSRGAFESLGLDIDEMERKFAAGGESANQAFNQVITGLALMEDPLKRNEVGVALFGTMWEDLGPAVVEQLAGISEGAYGSADALEQIKAVKYDDLGRVLQALTRQVELLAIPLAELAIPVISAAVEVLGNNMDAVIPIVSGLTAAVLAYKSAMAISQIIDYVSKAMFAYKTSAEATTIAQRVLNLVMAANPFALVATVIAGLVTAIVTLWNTNEDFRTAVIGIWQEIRQTFVDVWEKIKGIFANAKEAFANIGANIIDGIKQGISNAWDGLKQQVADLGQKLPEWIKTPLGINSPSKVFAQIGDYCMQGLQGGLEDGSGGVVGTAAEISKAVVEAAKGWVEDARFYDRMAAADEVKFWQELKETAQLGTAELAKVNKLLYDAQKNASKDAFEASKAWLDKQVKYNDMSANDVVAAWQRVVDRKDLLADEQLRAEEELLAAQQTLWNEQQKVAADAADALARRAENLSGFAGLFDSVISEKVKGGDLLQNLRGQVDTLKQWQEDIAELAGRGLTEELLAELRELGPASAAEIAALTKLSDGKLDEYAALYAEKTRLAMEQAKKEAGLAAQSVSGAMNAAQPEMQQAAADVAQAFCDTMQQSGEDFYQIGLDAMAGFHEGLKVEGQKALNTARRIANQIIATMRRALDIHSPSRKMSALVGVPAAQGVFVGFEDEMANMGRRMQAAVEAQTVRLGAGVAARAEGEAANSGITREVHNNTKTVEKVARLEGDGLTGELVRLLRLRLKEEDKRVGDSLED